MIALSDSKIRFLHHPAEPEFGFLPSIHFSASILLFPKYLESWY